MKIYYIKRKSDGKTFSMEDVQCRYTNGILISEGGDSMLDEYGNCMEAPIIETFIENDDFEICFDIVPEIDSDYTG